MRILVIGTVFALAAAATDVMAADATIGGVSINLPAPVGFCELTASNPSDSRMITVVDGALARGGNKLLGISADCQQLADWRAGRRHFIDDYAQYQTPADQMDQQVASPEAAIHQTCATMRAHGNDVISNDTATVKSIIEDALKKVKMNSLTFAGVFAEDQMGCYAGEIEKLQAESGAEKTQLILIAITVVKNKFIFGYRFAVYTGTDMVDALLAKLKDTTAEFYAANK